MGSSRPPEITFNSCRQCFNAFSAFHGICRLLANRGRPYSFLSFGFAFFPRGIRQMPISASPFPPPDIARSESMDLPGPEKILVFDLNSCTPSE